MKINKGSIVDDFINHNLRQYVIPVYQRKYSWSEEQCKILFDDIIALCDSGREHYCGAIVYSAFDVESEEKIESYIIIDGQQRLTTIYILLKAMMDVDDGLEKEKIESYLFNRSKHYDVAPSYENKLKLKAVRSDNQQLAYLMSDDFEKMDKSSAIWHNYQFFKDLLIKEIGNHSIREIRNSLEDLLCAVIKVEKEDDPQEMFDRINSTGVPLTLQDKIRNYALMTDTNQEYLYDKYWLPFEELLPDNIKKNFFLDYLNIKVDGFVREQEAYEKFKRLVDGVQRTDTLGKNEIVLKDILYYADFYHTFLYGNVKYGDKINQLLSGLRNIKQTTIYLFLLRVFEDYDKKVITQKELENVLSFFMSYMVRRIILEIPSNSLRGLFKTLYNRLFIDESHKSCYYDTIVTFFKQQSSSDKLPKEDEFFEALCRNNRLYKTTYFCKYLLASLENCGKEKIDLSCVTIEHIMPQNDNSEGSWQKMFGDDWGNAQEKYLHSIGNLTLTGYNSELGNKPYEEKMDILYGRKKIDDSNSVILSYPKATFLYEDVDRPDKKWSIAAIEERAKRLSRGVMKVFPIQEAVNKNIKFTTPGYKEECIGNLNDNIKHISVSYYILLGEQVNVFKKDMKSLFLSFVNKLYEINSEIIEKLANDETVVIGNRIGFSFNPDHIKHEKKVVVANSNIYIWHNLSVVDIIKFMKFLLDQYGIAYDDLIISLKLKRE